MEPDLRFLQQKKKYEEEIDWLVKKKVWCEFEEKRKQYQQLMQEYSAKKAEFDDFTKQIAPMKSKIKEIEKISSELRGTHSRYQSVVFAYQVDLFQWPSQNLPAVLGVWLQSCQKFSEDRRNTLTKLARSSHLTTKNCQDRKEANPVWTSACSI